MRIPIYQVDAFSRTPFAGNPAAVCVLEDWPKPEVLQDIAAENNLAETAFIVRQSPGEYLLRWFTPEVEVDLCGHATLASAYVVLRFLDPGIDSVSFATASGRLTVERSDDRRLAMDFPSQPLEPADPPAGLADALGANPCEIWRARDLMAVFENESDIAALRPHMEHLKAIGGALGVIATARSDTVDFVSRFFAPAVGIPEDPVTGSSHCMLVPYWAERLGKTMLHARQLSRRGGELFCEYLGDRVTIAGHAALFLVGHIELPVRTGLARAVAHDLRG